MSEMFEKATRMKLRFHTDVGNIDVEDMWDVPLKDTVPSLDSIARRINRDLKQHEEESFVDTKKDEIDEVLELRMEIVKHIISVKLEEREAAKQAADNRLRKQRILAIMADKQDKELQGKSMDELESLLNELK